MLSIAIAATPATAVIRNFFLGQQTAERKMAKK
jgi:hypothetical protein